MDRNTGEPKKDSTNMKTFPLFFQIRKRNFSFKFLQQRCVSAGPQGFTQTGSGQPVSYTFTVIFYGLHTRGIMAHMLIIIFELMDDNFLSINVILSA